MKTIALFGGTGKTGEEFLKIAMDKGYPVKVLARDPGKLKQDHTNLTVIKGDVLNEKDVDEVVKESDIAVSLFGHVKGSPDWLQTEGTKNIVKAMKRHNVKRIISLSGGGLPYPEKDQPKLPDKIIKAIMKIFVPKILKDAERHAEVLMESGLKWSIVRGPRLTSEPVKGNYRVGWVGVNASTKIGRADLADFIVKLVEDESYDSQMPFVSY